MSKQRGLYNQSEGNESRDQKEVFAERMQDNQNIEGDYLRPMIVRAKQGALKEMAALRDRMKSEYASAGVPLALAQERADSCLRQAMNYLRI